MPKKWTHLEFMTELVYDLIFPGQTAAHLLTIGELDDRSIDSARSFSSFALVNEAQLEEDIDLDCDTGRVNYLTNKSTARRRKRWSQINLGQSGTMDSDTHHCRLPRVVANIVGSNFCTNSMTIRERRIRECTRIGLSCGDAWFAM